jgi:hypothetical protein
MKKDALPLRVERLFYLLTKFRTLESLPASSYEKRRSLVFPG